MARNRFAMIIALALVALMLGACSMAGSAVQGVGSVFDKTGGAIKKLG